ncbi:MAG: Ig-like domain-containing protein [Prevotella sp.]|nr:Ig-like domain-containing protein [Prevotella sp.]
MKRLLLIWALFLCSLTAAFAQFSGSGSGTKDDPYLIFYAEQLNQMRNFLGKDSVYFKLMSDIDLTSFQEDNYPNQGWLPVGNNSAPFKGIFEGNNHKITGLSINRTSNDYTGFWGYTDHAQISNVSIFGSSVKGNNYCGTVLGYSQNTKITNVSASFENVGGAKCIAGFCGIARNSSFTNCSTSVNSTITSTDSISGGMLGKAFNSTLSKCTVEATVKASKGSVGGVVGYSENVNFDDISCQGAVSSDNNDVNVGGLVGTNNSTDGTTIKSCNIKVKVTSKGNAGGLFAFVSGFGAKCISDCHFKADIEGASNVGGLIGYIKEGVVSVDSSETVGSITGTGDHVAGAIGYSEGGCIEGINRFCHVGTIKGNNYVGGVIARIAGIKVSQPTLHKYSLGDSGPYYGRIFGKIIKDFSETIEKSSNKLIAIHNCVNIGNIIGKNKIGGILGYEDPATSYEAKTHNVNCTYYPQTGIISISQDGYNILNYYAPSIFLYKDDKYTYKKIRAGEGDGGPVNFSYNTYYCVNTGLSITDCSFSGSLLGENSVGGIAGGKNGGVIARNIAYCKIKANSELGGIVGVILGDGSRETKDSISVVSNSAICLSIASSSYTTGLIYGKKSNDYVVIGKLGTAESNFALATSKVFVNGVLQTLSDSPSNGTAVGESSLKLRATYVAAGWDFNNDWTIQETETYPYKPWQAAPPKITSNLVSQETTISGKSIDGGTVYIEVGDSYKSSVVCNGNQWSFSVPALQSGDPVRLYAVVDGKGQSPYTDATVNYPGSGTEADPYRVYTAADLQGVYKKGFYKLMNDIDLTEWINKYSPTEGWPAIGKNGVTAVYFDGGGHKITGLWCNTTAGYNGLFSNFPAGYIKNLTVETASGKSVKGGDYTAVLIGRMTNGKIENVTVKGNAEGSNHVGGITGMTSAMKFNNVNYEGETTSSSTKDIYIGGLAGLANGSVDVISSYAKVKLTTTGSNANAGGIFGKGSNVILKNSHAETTAKTLGDSTFVGGLVGVTEATDSITKCYSEGTLAATGAKSYVGGLVGINNGEGWIENCYSTADATSTLYAAGLVAYNYGKVSNSYSKGNVNSEFYGAGAVGYNDGAKATVNNLVAGNPQVNVTDKSGWSIRVLGGFKNGASQPGENNYALSTMILSVNGVPKKVTDNILDGYAKTEDELKSEATYEKLGWSFSRVWKIEEGKAWPTLDMTVYGLVTSVILDQKTLTLKKGQTATLRATVKPDDATNKTVAWSSSDTSIATVKDGVVRGVGNGKATIIATSTDGTNLADSAIVTVYAPVNDTIVLKDTTTLKNKTIMYPVYLNNEDPVCSFQFDVYLPDGMDIAKNSKDKYDIQFAGRQEDTHSITSNKVSTGAIRVIAFSIANDNFSGKSGALVNIPITIGDVAKGDYNISIRNIVLADASEKEYYCQDATGVIHVNDVIMGDANSDGKVSLADVNSTVNYIAEKPSENFYFAAADMNNNGIINVSDVNAIVNVLAEVKTSASAKKNVFAVANEVTTNDKMYCSNITVAPGETATLPVNLVNSGKYCSFQFDILLPKGITVDSTVNQSGKVRYSASLVTSRCVDHSLTSNLIRGNRYRVIVFSLSNTDIEGMSGPVVNIKLKAEKDATEGDYTLKMERVVLATADEKEYYPADSESTVTVSTDTGINGIIVDPSSVKIYDLQGRKVNKPTQGVYIVNGKKVVIK